jgi:chromosome segregation ATPase
MMDKLAGIDTDLQNLQSSMDKRLADKEAELRRIMNDEFEAEQQRLAAQNLSEAAIAEEMRKFDEQRIIRLNTDLAAYRQQLEAEKFASEANFRQLQEEYRNNLAALQHERSLILEASRAREAILYTQAEGRIGELSSLYEQSRTDLNAAREELSRLALEQERAALIEGQLNGYYIELDRQIQSDLLGEAAGTLKTMRDFLNTPSFLYIRPLQSRREFHLAAVDALSSLVEGARQSRDLDASAVLEDNSAEIAAYENTIAELQDQNARLEQTVGDQRQTIAAYTSEGTSLSRRLAEFENTITGLRDQNLTLEQNLRARGSEAADLKSQVSNLQNQAAIQEQTLRTRETEITSLQTRAAAQEQRLQGEITSLQVKNADQAKQIAEKDTAISQLSSEKAQAEENYKNLQNRVNTARELFE